MNAYEKVKAWEESRCRKRMPNKMMGRTIIFLCLRPTGHEGACMEGIVETKSDMVAP